MKYGSVCSGIEAASVAWESLGFIPAWFAEIEPFPCAALAHHWPHIPNLGDMTQIATAIPHGEVEAPEILVGGTPCQAFSVAGLRAGLSDARGQLTIAYVELADAIDRKRREYKQRPAIIVWENVPGVLSSKDNAFGCFLAALAGESEPLQPSGKKWTNAGYVFGPTRTIAWRILDAQYFGVAQRRRRVFVVASARTDIDPGKILFEFESLRRDTPPCRETRASTASHLGTSIKVGSHWDSELNPHPTLNQSHNVGGIGSSNQEVFSQRGSGLVGHKWPADIACTLNAAFGSKLGLEDQHINGGASLFVPANLEFYEAYQHHGWRESDCAGPLTANLEKGVMGSTPLIRQDATVFNWQAAGNTSSTLGADEHCTGTLQATIAYSVALRGRDGGSSAELGDNLSGALRASVGGGDKPHVLIHTPAIALAGNTIGRAPENGGNGAGYSIETGYTLTKSDQHGVMHNMHVRRLTPRECERLQGFPDNHTLVPYGRKISPEKMDRDFAKYLMRGGNLTFEECCGRATDGPRYKAIGNSMAVPVMRWIGERILLAAGENDD